MKQKFTRKLRITASSLLLSLATFALPVAVSAHEFWLQPETFHPQVGDTLAVHMLIGSDFKGDSLPYIPDLVKRFIVVGRDGQRPAGAGFAADPAGKVEINTPGLHIIAYENHGTDTENDWPVFRKYLLEEGLEQHLAEAERLASNNAGIATEFYRRNAIALMQVGPAEEVTLPTLGLGFVIVPLQNPYALAKGQALQVQVRHLGRPLPDAQINVLNDQAGGSVAKIRTDNLGMATIALDRPGTWMLNSVTINRDTSQEFQWRSEWASLTFRLN